MNLTEKAAYLKGLADGMNLDETKAETKLLKNVLDLLLDLAEDNEDLRAYCEELEATIDEIDEDLGMVEEDFYGDCDCEDECDCCDDDCDCDCEDDLYEVTCPKCGDTIYLDDSMLDDGSIDCPGCGENLEFEFECDCCEDDDCDCDCCHE